MLVALKPNLAQARLRKLWSTHRLSKEAHVANTTILAIERGKTTNVRLGTIEKLAKALGMDPHEIDWPGNPLGDSGPHERVET